MSAHISAKGTFHKSCSCRMCKRGRASDAGKATRKQNERRLRRGSKLQLRKLEPDAVFIHPISSPDTD